MAWLGLAWQGGKSSKGKAMTRLVVLGVRGDGALVDHGRKEAFVDVRCTLRLHRAAKYTRGVHCERKPACAEPIAAATATPLHHGSAEPSNAVHSFGCPAGLRAALSIQWYGRKGKGKARLILSRKSSRLHCSARQRQ